MWLGWRRLRCSFLLLLPIVSRERDGLELALLLGRDSCLRRRLCACLHGRLRDGCGLRRLCRCGLRSRNWLVVLLPLVVPVPALLAYQVELLLGLGTLLTLVLWCGVCAELVPFAIHRADRKNNRRRWLRQALCKETAHGLRLQQVQGSSVKHLENASTLNTPRSPRALRASSPNPKLGPEYFELWNLL